MLLHRPGIVAVVAASVITFGLAGCGSSHHASTSTTAKTGTDAVAAVTADWTAFFSAKTPVTRRVALLQDGQAFSSIIKAQAGSTLAKGASAKVTKVTVHSTKADVVYDIVVDGTPALKGQKGTAVAQGGQWKVGVASFCGLLALENGGKTAGLPAACRS